MRGAVTQALHRHLTKHTENLMEAAAHLQLEAVRRAAAEMVRRKRLLMTHREQLTDPTTGNTCSVSSITMPCMTQQSTNLLCAPHTPPHLRPQASKTPLEHPTRPAGPTTKQPDNKHLRHPRAHLSPRGPPGTAQPNEARPAPPIHRCGRAGPRQPTPPSPPGPGATPPRTDHHARPRPPPGNPPRQGPEHPPGLVPPTRELDQAHRQSPPGPSHPR